MKEVKIERIFPLVSDIFKDFINKSKHISNSSDLSRNEQLLLLILFMKVLEDSLIKQMGETELLNIKNQINNL